MDQVLPPYYPICYVTDILGQGSGVFISTDCVLTAAHVVVGSNGIIAPAGITISPGYDRGMSSTSAYSVAAISSYAVTIRTIQDSEYDFAVLHLSEPVLNIQYMGLDIDYQGGTVTISGYPGSAAGGQVNVIQTASDVPGRSLLTFDSLGPGSSGGPVWTSTAANSFIVGIVSSALATSPRTGFAGLITAKVHSQVQAWVANYDSPSPVATYQQQLVPEHTVLSNTIVYRFVNLLSGAHLFTSDPIEAKATQGLKFYIPEDNTFGELQNNSRDRTICDVYRFFDMRNGDHILTASISEYDSLMKAGQDLVYEGVCLHEHSISQLGDLAVYRFLDKTDGTHFYTANPSEIRSLSSHDFASEGVAFYAPA